MFPPQVDYRRADGLDDALSLLATDREAVPIAGGQGLVQDMKLDRAAPDLLVDVSGVEELAGLRGTDEVLAVGALTTHAELAASDLVADRAPVLAAVAGRLGDRQVRNRGTVGGNLAEADPAADLPAAVLAAGATLRLRGPNGERAVDAAEFFRGDGETALDPAELLVAVDVPAHDRAAYERRTHPATGYAMLGVAAAADLEAGTVADPRVAVTGAVDPAGRLPGVEAALDGTPVDDIDPEAAADEATEGLPQDRFVGDAHASAGFRREVLPTYVERAVESLAEQ